MFLVELFPLLHFSQFALLENSSVHDDLAELKKELFASSKVFLYL